MTETSRSRAIPRPGMGATLAVAILLGASAGHAEAQYGFGGYGGFGFGFNTNAYSDTNFLNSRSNNLASIAAANAPRALQAPRFQVRDNSFYDKYDLQTRVSMINRVARDPGRELGTADPTGVLPTGVRPRPTQSTASAAPPAPAPAAPRFLLADFFDRNRRLVWPSIAPITGDLGKKQEVADQSVLVVLDEHEARGIASLSNVTESRRMLLDYGRPALDFVRKQTTPAISDSFHVFLLSLYSQLELAATVPKAPR